MRLVGGGGGGRSWEIVKFLLSIVYSIRMGEGGGGERGRRGGGKNYAWGRYIRYAPSPLVYQTWIAVDILNLLRIDCPPLNNE